MSGTVSESVEPVTWLLILMALPTPGWALPVIVAEPEREMSPLLATEAGLLA